MDIPMITLIAPNGVTIEAPEDGWRDSTDEPPEPPQEEPEIEDEDAGMDYW